MDLITHVVVAYATSFAVFGQAATNYIAAAALAGGLPDADVLLFPLARYFPIFRHHGITHSFIGVTIIALIGAYLATFIASGTFLLFFLAMEIGGLTHIALDGFTNFSIPPLSPLSSKSLHVDADVAVNVFTIVFSVAAFFLLLSERGTVAASLWADTVWIVLAFYVSYVATRLLCRFKTRRIKVARGYTAVIPTANPFSWIFIKEKNDSKAYSVEYRRYSILKGFSVSINRLRMTPIPSVRGAVKSASEAISVSYLKSMKRMRFFIERYKFATAKKKGDVYEVSWFSPEFINFGRSFGVVSTVDKFGNVLRTKTALLRVSI